MVIEVDGEVWDLGRPILHDARVRLIRTEDPEALAVIRHDCAHVMAEAVQGLFPGTQVTIGPAIDNGFYYDFFRAEPFSTDDLARIEARMAEIVQGQQAVLARGSQPRHARDKFRAAGRAVQGWSCLDAIPRRPAGDALPSGRLVRPVPRPACARPPARSARSSSPRSPAPTGVATAATRSCSGSTAPPLPAGRARRLSAPARGGGAPRPSPHRPRDGSVPRPGRGARARCSGTRTAGSCGGRWRTISARRLDRTGYSEVKSPQLIDKVLWERSGPLATSSASNMFFDRGRQAHLRAQADELPRPRADLQPGPAQLPRPAAARWPSSARCHRNEPSGALHGIMRVRAFTQDDAHIFCTRDRSRRERRLLRPAARASTGISASPTCG